MSYSKNSYIETLNELVFFTFGTKRGLQEPKLCIACRLGFIGVKKLFI